MRRFAALALALALLGTACDERDGKRTANGVDTPDVPQTSPTDGSVPPGPQETTTPPGEEGGPDETTPPADDEIPGPGEPTTVKSRVESTGTDPAGENLPDPVAVLARTPEEAARAAALLPPGAAARLTSWGRYATRALLVVTGGAQPDPTHRVVITAVGVIKGGKVIEIFGSIQRDEAAASQVISIPWAVVSVNVGATRLAEKCQVAFEGQTARNYDCP